MSRNPNPSAFAVNMLNAGLMLRAADDAKVLSCIPAVMFSFLDPADQDLLINKVEFVNKIFGDAQRVDWAGIA